MDLIQMPPPTETQKEAMRRYKMLVCSGFSEKEFCTPQEFDSQMQKRLLIEKEDEYQNKLANLYFGD